MSILPYNSELDWVFRDPESYFSLLPRDVIYHILLSYLRPTGVKFVKAVLPPDCRIAALKSVPGQYVYEIGGMLARDDGAPTVLKLIKSESSRKKIIIGDNTIKISKRRRSYHLATLFTTNTSLMEVIC